MVLCCHVKYSTVKADRPVSTGFLDDEHTHDPAFYRDLSELWLEDPLHQKSVTCSNCGTGTRCVFYCTTPECHLGLCFECYDKRKHPHSNSINWPDWDHYQLMESGACASVVDHGPTNPANDLSYVVDPTIVVTILGLGVERDGERGPSATQQMKDELRLFGSSHSLTSGAGFYPYFLNHTKVSSQDTFRQKVTDVGEQLSEVAANRLIIHIKAHNSPSGYLLSNTRYSPAQLYSTILEPLITAFRTSRGRTPSSPVHVMLNTCAADIDIWNDEIVQVQPVATRFDLVIFSHPVLLSEQGTILVSYARNMVNARNHTHPSWNSAYAISRSMTGEFASQVRPAVLMHGFDPITEFAYLAPVGLPAPSSASSRVSLQAPLPAAHQAFLEASSSSGSGEVGASFHAGSLATVTSSSSSVYNQTNNFIIPMYSLPAAAASSSGSAVSAGGAPWPVFTRNRSVLEFIRGQPADQLQSLHLTNVDEPQIIDSLNLLAASLAMMSRRTTPMWTTDSVSLAAFRKWAKKNGWVINQDAHGVRTYIRGDGGAASGGGDTAMESF